MHLIPGGPFSSSKANFIIRKILTAKYGLDKPLIVQYFLYLKNICTLNFGESITTVGSKVSNIIIKSFIHSLMIGLCSITLAIFFGIIIGTISAFKQNEIIDHFTLVIIFIIASIPTIITANLLSWIFRDKLKLCSYNTTNVIHYILAIIATLLPIMCFIIKLMRTSVIDTLNTDFIKMAQAKGLSKKTILFKHCLRNSLIPIITFAGPTIAYLITGSIIIESIFGINGIGSEYINYVTRYDYPVIMGMTIFFTFIMLIMMLISDLFCKIVNPRIELK